MQRRNKTQSLKDVGLSLLGIKDGRSPKTPNSQLLLTNSFNENSEMGHP